MKQANNLQVIPSPTINFDFQEILDKINGTLPAKAPAVAAAMAADNNEPNAGAIVIIGANNVGNYDSDDNDNANDSKMLTPPMPPHGRWKELEAERPSAPSSTMPFTKA
jgi:hypothetical protein